MAVVAARAGRAGAAGHARRDDKGERGLAGPRAGVEDGGVAAGLTGDGAKDLDGRGFAGHARQTLDALRAGFSPRALRPRRTSRAHSALRCGD